jgi:hypothetical protein
MLRMSLFTVKWDACRRAYLRLHVKRDMYRRERLRLYVKQHVCRMTHFRLLVKRDIWGRISLYHKREMHRKAHLLLWAWTQIFYETWVFYSLMSEQIHPQPLVSILISSRQKNVASLSSGACHRIVRGSLAQLSTPNSLDSLHSLTDSPIK